MSMAKDKRRARRAAIWIVVGAMALGTGARSWAADEETISLSELQKHLTLSASDRMRGEFVSWFDPQSGNSNNNYNFFANRLRAGITLSYPTVEFFVEAQDTRLVNLPGADSKNASVGLLGPGAAYFDNTHTREQGEVFLHRGYVTIRKFGLPGVSARAGRFGYAHGQEKMPKDTALAWLQDARISQRLIGNFDYTHVGRSFDGALAMFDHGPFNLTTMVSHPTMGGFNVNANRALEKIDLISTTATVTEPDGMNPMSAQLFYMLYQDRRDLVVTDNRLTTTGACSPGAHKTYRTCDQHQITLSTIGGNLTQLIALGPGKADLLAWTAYQVGDWQSLTHVGWAYALEAGYQLPDAFAKPWIRVGIDRSSGDGDRGDGHHGTFFQLIPTARSYAKFPFFNLMNNQDVFLQGIFKPCKGATAGMSGHWLRATESADLWYAGGGATSNSLFGYSGIRANGRHELGYLTDLELSYTFDKAQTWDKTVTIYGYFGHAFGEGIVSSNFRGNDADYGYIETTLAF